jgi:hypothetical protein
VVAWWDEQHRRVLGSQAAAEEARDVRADGFLAKPYRTADMKTALVSALWRPFTG